MKKPLVLPLTILREASGTIYASMANFSYAALALRLLECTIEGVRHFKFIREPLAFLYIVDATEWDVIPYEATRLPGHGIVMAQSEDPIPLMRHTLRQPKHSLHEDDFQSCLEAVRVELPLPPCSNDVSEILLGLAKHFCGTDNDNDEAVQGS